MTFKIQTNRTSPHSLNDTLIDLLFPFANYSYVSESILMTFELCKNSTVITNYKSTYVHINV